MVAIIKPPGKSIRRIFLYNEHKLDKVITDERGEETPAAVLLMAENYPMDLDVMTRQQRLNMLLKTADTRPDIKTNSIHISLNFAPGEDISRENLTAIASQYMHAIGYGKQPYLVYQHFDAAHPHLHIVTTKISPNGKRLETHVAKNLSEPIRKDLEKRYGLVRAEEHKRDLFRLKPVSVEKVLYAKTDTKRAIGNVLDFVLNRYRYGSLSELNAVLNLYNVQAEEGGRESRIYKHKGLQYRLLDHKGSPVGLPIKASLYHNRPTLAYLERRFKSGKTARNAYSDQLRTSIDMVLKSRAATSPESFMKALYRKGIHLVQQHNKEGRLYGLTYVDHRNKCVFKGSDLGKYYGANAIPIRLAEAMCRLNTIKYLTITKPNIIRYKEQEFTLDQPDNLYEKSLWEILSESQQDYDFTPKPLRRKKKNMI